MKHWMWVCACIAACGGPAPMDAGSDGGSDARDAGSDGGSDAGAPRARAFALEWANVVESAQSLGVLADSRLAPQPDDAIVVSVSLGGAAATFAPRTDDEELLGEAPSSVTQTLAWYAADGALIDAREVAVADPGLEGFTATGYGLDVTGDGAVLASGRFMAGARFGGDEVLSSVLETNREVVEDPPMTFTTYTSEEGYLARFDPDHDFTFVRRAKSETAYGHFTIVDVAALADGSSIVIGTYDDPVTLGELEPAETRFAPTADREMFLARFEPDGSLGWARRAQGDAEPRRIEVFADGSSVALVRHSGALTLGPGEANERTLEAPSEGVLAWDAVVRFDPDGALVWAQPVQSDATMYPGPRDLVVHEDGSVVVAGTFRGDVVWPDTERAPVFLYGIEGLVVRIAGDGELLWQTRVQPVHSVSVQAISPAAEGWWVALTVSPRGATFVPEGGAPFVLEDSTSDTRLVLLRFDGDGLLRAAHLVGENEIGADDMLTLASGDLVIVGRYGEGTVLEPGTDAERTLPSALAFRNTMILRYSPLP